jgi:hypothetical protein
LDLKTMTILVKDKKITASYLKALLRMQYAAPQYATVEEVRNTTGRIKRVKGTTGPRYADMLAIGLWPSNGLEIMGFEVKVSRADWLKELSDDKKAVPVKQYCDRWYLVTSSEKIVKEGELPSDWGLMVLNGNSIKVIVEAPKLNAEPLDRGFLASLMRNATLSNPDYCDVQAHIITDMMSKIPLPKSKSALKSTSRRTLNGMANEIKRLKKVIADMDVSCNAASIYTL